MKDVTKIVVAMIGLAFAAPGEIPAAEGGAAPLAPKSTKPDLTEFAKARSERRYVGVPHKVLAFYYTWYGTPQGHGKWVHWKEVNAEKREISDSTHYPALGAYDSYDPEVIEQHITLAKSHGIDGFICTWWRQKDLHDIALEKVLGIAAKRDFEISIYWETVQDAKKDTVKRAVSDMLYVLEKYGSHPAFLKVGGKPVIFVYGRVMKDVRPNLWPEIVTTIRSRSGKDFLLIADGYKESNAQVFDGIHTYSVARPISGKTPDEMRTYGRESFRNAVQMARKAGKISCLTVIPGYDDTKIRKPGLQTERHDGQTYGVLWEEAIAADPDWILVTSWNEWHEGSEIEPSHECGDKYLTMTAKYASQFKKSPSSQIKVVPAETGER